VWQRTPITVNNRWVNYWLMASNAGSGPQLVVLMGQNVYTSLANAQAATFASEMSEVSLFTSEAVVLYKLTYRRGGAFGAPGNAQLTEVNQVTQSLVTGSTSGAITAAQVSADTTNFNGALTGTETTVQLALDKLDDYVARNIFGTRAAPRSIVAATGITSGAGHMSTTANRQQIYVEGSVAGDSVAATISAGTSDGQVMVIIGRNDDNTVTLDPAVTTNYVTNRGSFTLAANNMAVLVWDTSAWVEQSRN
jgi:hypothetical protein